ncbi:MAG: hypothetical protein S4CHLAM107_10400 [Chlamydiia bacterium]|nr:hypothetical protein [Chlamydiia bacterium]
MLVDAVPDVGGHPLGGGGVDVGGITPAVIEVTIAFVAVLVALHIPLKSSPAAGLVASHCVFISCAS